MAIKISETGKARALVQGPRGGIDPSREFGNRGLKVADAPEYNIGGLAAIDSQKAAAQKQVFDTIASVAGDVSKLEFAARKIEDEKGIVQAGNDRQVRQQKIEAEAADDVLNGVYTEGEMSDKIKEKMIESDATYIESLPLNSKTARNEITNRFGLENEKQYWANKEKYSRKMIGEAQQKKQLEIETLNETMSVSPQAMVEGQMSIEALRTDDKTKLLFGNNTDAMLDNTIRTAQIKLATNMVNDRELRGILLSGDDIERYRETLFGSLSEDELASFVREAQIKQDTEDRQVSARQRTATNGEISAKIVGGVMSQPELDDMLKSEAITPGDWAKQTKALETEKERVRKKDEDFIEIETFVAAGVTLPNDKVSIKKVDEWERLQLENGADPQEVLSKQIQLGVLSTKTKTILKSGLASGNPEHAMKVAGTVNQLLDSRPSIFSKQFTDEERAFALNIKNGVDIQDAMKIRDVGASTSKEDKARFKALAKSSIKEDEVRDVVNDILGVDEDEVPEEVINDYQRLVGQYILVTGKVESAKEMAIQSLGWGKTDVGSIDFMKRPMEQEYGVGNEDEDVWISQQIETLLEEQGIDVNEIDINANPTPAGNKPSYSVSIMTPDGLVVLSSDYRPNKKGWNAYVQTEAGNKQEQRLKEKKNRDSIIDKVIDTYQGKGIIDSVKDLFN